jgi:hypothetical protein
MEVRYQLRYSPVSQIIVSVNRRQHTVCEYLFAPTVPARLMVRTGWRPCPCSR